MRTLTHIVLGLLALLLVAPSLPAGGPSDTSITYQGRLRSGGLPANGTFKMHFSLWTTPTGNTQVGSTFEVLGVQVTNGLFTVELSFGPNAYSGPSPRWLEIVVDGNTLLPRQVITGAPFSVETRGLAVDAAKNVGIGTDTPLVPLHVETATSNVAIHGLNASPVIFSTVGVRGESASTNGIGVFGFASASTGSTSGVKGRSISTNGRGVFGAADALSGTTSGVRGQSISTDGTGVHGFAFATSGTNYGVRGESRSTDGTGVFGLSTTTTGTNYGVRGESRSTDGTGVFGLSTATTGTTNGVRGDCISPDGTGVHGFASAFAGTNFGVRGRTNSPDGFAGYFEGGRNYFQGNVGIGTSTPNAKLDIFAQGNGAELLRFSMERAWVFRQSSTGANTTLDLHSLTDFKTFQVSSQDGATIAAFRAENGANRVGIGTASPGFTLEVNGSAGKPGGGSWSVASDRRLKDDIHDLEGSLDQLLQLRGVTFEYKNPEAINELTGTRIGMIAQEVETVFPDWVSEGGHGYKTLTFRGFEALTVEALRELREENNELRNENDNLRERLEKLEALMSNLATPVASRAGK